MIVHDWDYDIILLFPYNRVLIKNGQDPHFIYESWFEMNDFNNAELLAGLLKRADSGEHSRFEYIRSIKAYLAARTARNAVKKLVSNFTRSEDKLFKSWSKHSSYVKIRRLCIQVI